jgi:tetratricopeptide (TPR) repeat protein
MSFSRTGKIAGDLMAPLSVVISAPHIACGLLRILSAETSAIIAFRDGRYIIGARVIGTDIVGVDALERVRPLKRGLYTYYDSFTPEQFAEIDQGLAIDVHEYFQLSADALDSASADGSPASPVAVASGVPAPTAGGSAIPPAPSGAPGFPPAGGSGIPPAPGGSSAIPPAPGSPFPSAPAGSRIPPAPGGAPVAPVPAASAATAQTQTHPGALPPPPPSPFGPPPPRPFSPQGAAPFAPAGANPFASAPNPFAPSAANDVPADANAPLPPQLAALFPPQPGDRQLPPGQVTINAPPVHERIVDAVRKTYNRIVRAASPQPQPAPTEEDGWHVPSAPQGQSVLDRALNMARSTYTKMKSRRVAEPVGTAEYQAAPPAQPAPEPAKSPKSTFVDVVKRTGLKMASRLKHNQSDPNRIVDNQKLRSVQVQASEADEKEEAAKSALRRLDLGTISGIAITAIACLLVAGSVYVVYENTGTRPYIRQAQSYLKKNEISLAADELSLALQKNPNDIDALRMLAHVHELAGDIVATATDYNQLQQLVPGDTTVRLKYAYAETKLGNYEESEAACSSVLKDYPANISALAIRAINRVRTNQASVDLHELLKPDVGLPAWLACDYFSALGDAYWERSHLKDAISYYTRAIACTARPAELMKKRGECWLMLNEPKQALRDFESAKRLSDWDPDIYCFIAKADKSCGKYRSAIAAYQNALLMSPKKAEICYEIAWCQYTLRRYGTAVAWCDRALALDPRRVEADQLKADALRRAHGQPALVVTTVNPSDDEQTGAPASESLVDAGTTAFMANDYPSAIRYLSAATEKDPKDVNARRILAHALLASGRTKDAYDQFAFMDRTQSLSSAALLAYADTAIKCGDTKRGIELYSRCISKDPQWHQARQNFIKACLSCGLKDKARQLADEGKAVSATTEERDAYDKLLPPAN